ncbi:MAG: YncE family protein, partial [Limisphaerales bacterium]
PVDSIILDKSFGENPFMLALDSMNQILYAACWRADKIAVIELVTKDIAYIPVGKSPHAPVIVADSLLYVTCEGNHVAPYKVYVINTNTQTVVDSIDVGRYPNGIAVLKP